MSWTTAKHAIDFFLENANPKPTIQFYGGEATLNLGVIRKCMEYASAKDPKVQFGITTNGLNIKRLYADLLNHDARITVSLDGPKEVHDKYRRNLRNEPTHEIIMRNIKIISDLSSEFVRSRLSVSATCWDLQDFTKIVDYFTELDGHYAGMFVGFVEKKGLSPITSKEHESTYKVIDDYLRYGLQYVHDIVQDVNPPGILKSLFDKHLSSLFTLSDITMPPQIPLDGVCLPGEFSIFVDVAGEFYICEKMIGILPIGNVHSGVKSRIKREAIRQLQSIRDAKCSPCWLSRLCRPCFAVAKDSNGNLTSAGLHERCHDYRDSKLVYLALFGELLHVDHERRHIEYFKNVNLEL